MIEPRLVNFKSKGETLEGHFYVPEGEGPFPVVVMGGGWCYVKEMVLHQYAEPMLEAGLAVLTFDYRTVGGSTGEPRQHLDPYAQMEDYRNAISFAETLPEVNKDRIAVWGISYAGGHVLVVGGEDPRVKVTVSVIPVIDGYKTMRLVHGYGKSRFEKLQETLIESRRKEYETGEVSYICHNAADPDTTPCTWPFPTSNKYFTSMKESIAPRYENRNTVESTELLLNYNVMANVKRFETQPVMMIVVQDDAHTPTDLQVEAFAQIPSPNKEMFILRKMTHIELYSTKSHLAQAAQAGADFLAKHLL